MLLSFFIFYFLTSLNSWQSHAERGAAPRWWKQLTFHFLDAITQRGVPTAPHRLHLLCHPLTRRFSGLFAHTANCLRSRSSVATAPSPLARFPRKPLLLLFAAVARQEFFRFKRWPRNSTLSKNVSTLYQCGSYIKYVFFCFANSPNKLMFLLHKIKNNKTERRVS